MEGREWRAATKVIAENNPRFKTSGVTYLIQLLKPKLAKDCPLSSYCIRFKIPRLHSLASRHRPRPETSQIQMQLWQHYPSAISLHLFPHVCSHPFLRGNLAVELLEERPLSEP